MRANRVLFLCSCLGWLMLGACGGDDDTDVPAAEGTTARDGSAGTTPPAPGATTAAGTTAKLPTNACALLTLAEVQQLSPKATTEGKATTRANEPVPSVVCQWEWTDPADPIGGSGSLEVKVSNFPPGTSAATVKSSLQASARDAGTNGAEVPGVGDFAVFTSVIGGEAKARAIAKGLLIEVDLGGVGARQQKDKVIALLRAVVGRM